MVLRRITSTPTTGSTLRTAAIAKAAISAARRASSATCRERARPPPAKLAEATHAPRAQGGGEQGSGPRFHGIPWAFFGPFWAARSGPPARACGGLPGIRSSRIRPGTLHCAGRQQPKGGDPVSHCLSPRSPALWILASYEVSV